MDMDQRMPTDAAAYRRLAGVAEANLRDQVLAMWFPRAVDLAGALPRTTARTRRGAGDDKAVVYQARLTWVAAQAAIRDAAHAPTYAGHARHGLDFLGKMWDAHHGGFFWSLGGQGWPARGASDEIGTR